MKGWSLRYSLISKRKAGKRFRLWSVKCIFFLLSRKLSSQSCSRFWRCVSLLLNEFQVLIVKSFDFAFVKRILRLISVLFSYFFAMKKGIKLYNVAFPIWLLLVYPSWWIVILPLNFLVDSLVLLGIAKFAKLPLLKAQFWKVIWKVWWVGFLSDIIGAMLLFYFILWKAPETDFIAALVGNPFLHWEALLLVITATLLSAVMIYFLNLRRSLKQLNCSQQQKRKIARYLAYWTAPYLFIFPPRLILGILLKIKSLFL